MKTKTEDLTKLLQRSMPTVMSGIKQGVFPFAVAFKRNGCNKYKIIIHEEKVREYITGTDMEFDLSMEAVAKLTGETKKTLREGLQNGCLPYGVAFKTRPDSKHFYYVFYPAKLAEYVGKGKVAS